MKWIILTTDGKGVLRGVTPGTIIRRVYGQGAKALWSGDPGCKWIAEDGLVGIVVRESYVNRGYRQDGKVGHVTKAYAVLDHITKCDFR